MRTVWPTGRCDAKAALIPADPEGLGVGLSAVGFRPEWRIFPTSFFKAYRHVWDSMGLFSMLPRCERCSFLRIPEVISPYRSSGVPGLVAYMSYSLNSLKGGHLGDSIGTTIGLLRGILGV